MRIACLLLAAASALFGGWEELKSVPAAQRIEVSVRKGDAAKGTFVSASDTAIVVRDNTGERSIARDEIRKIRVADPSRRIRNGLIGTAVGAGVGLAAGWAVCPHCASEGAAGKYIGPGVGIGAGVGAAAGFLPAPWRTIYSSK
jgi:hypothetical protein